MGVMLTATNSNEIISIKRAILRNIFSAFDSKVQQNFSNS